MKKHVFKKSKEEKAPTPKSPSIYRFISESFSSMKDHIKSNKYYKAFCVWFLVLISLSLLGGIGWLIQDIRINFKEREQQKLVHQQIQQKIVQWEQIAIKYPDYRDAYYMLSVLEYQRGDINKSKGHLQQALLLDPNFKKGRELEKIIEESEKTKIRILK